jgi:GntR family transcriptional repressor for pyruvate dehydrogenase complex
MAVATGRRHGRVSETLVRRIQKQISIGKLLPGEKLPAEREMARKYRTSRVSVREAYRSLEEMGLISIRRGAEGGAFISDVDHEPVLKSLSLVLRLGKTSHEELTEARLLVEPPIARLAARRALPEDVAHLESVVRKQEASLKRTGDYGPFDLQFHRCVADCARNLPLKVLMNSLADLMVQLVSKVDVSEHVQHETCNFHRLILDAISRHDEEAAYAIMADHVAEVQDRLGHLPVVPIPAPAGQHAAPVTRHDRG